MHKQVKSWIGWSFFVCVANCEVSMAEHVNAITPISYDKHSNSRQWKWIAIDFKCSPGLPRVFAPRPLQARPKWATSLIESSTENTTLSSRSMSDVFGWWNKVTIIYCHLWILDSIKKMKHTARQTFAKISWNHFPYLSATPSFDIRLAETTWNSAGLRKLFTNWLVILEYSWVSSCNSKTGSREQTTKDWQ